MEKKSMASGILAVIQMLAGIILIAAVKGFAPVCTGMLKLENGSEAYMKCHYTGQVLFYFGILLVISGIVMFFTKHFLETGILSIVLGILAILVVGNSALGIGVCANAEMACNLTAGIAKICGGIAVAAGVCSTVKGIRK